MSNVITRGMGVGRTIITRGFGGSRIVRKIREIIRLTSKFAMGISLVSRWRK